MDEKIILEFFQSCHRIHNQAVKLFQNRCKDNLTAVEMWIIHALKHSSSCKTTELANHLGIPNSTLTGILDRMEKKGLVVRSRIPDDRRVVLVTLGPKHMENRLVIEEILKEIFSPANNSFSEELWLGMIGELKKIDKILLEASEEVADGRNNPNPCC
ncbi:regulatory protein MarR [Syntrophobotulus glycolicus DSM 8271]|uniref:Regulatory protein MarR n=1 Tax=Syntrophobotulus glycolicus (strain DSM 8271 / FlGlyR) TaxID=645991 RepID=F0SWR6_SYNGF|nr:MarR family transcriptional regulator [Syntrophobotulus glycolicus]ADY54606.1 regulatory protein MarR [Syntrophobotulus glycolicus DSM 8271]